MEIEPGDSDARAGIDCGGNSGVRGMSGTAESAQSKSGRSETGPYRLNCNAVIFEGELFCGDRVKNIYFEMRRISTSGGGPPSRLMECGSLGEGLRGARET